MNTVKDLLGKGMAINLMTPAGYVNLSVEKVKELAKSVSDGSPVKVFRHAGFSDTNVQMDQDEVKELVNYKLVDGGYNHHKNAYEYLVG